jgi:fumarate reductase subunit D
MRPNTWALFLVGTILAIVAATVLALVIPRMYPFQVASKAGA